MSPITDRQPVHGTIAPEEPYEQKVPTEDRQAVIRDHFRNIVLKELNKELKKASSEKRQRVIHRVKFSIEYENPSIQTMRKLLKEYGFEIEGLKTFDALQDEIREKEISEINLLFAQLATLEQIEEKLGIAKSWLEASAQYAETLKVENATFSNSKEWKTLQESLQTLKIELAKFDNVSTAVARTRSLTPRLHAVSAEIQSLLVNAQQPAFNERPTEAKHSKKENMSLPQEPDLSIDTTTLKEKEKEVAEKAEAETIAFAEVIARAKVLEITDNLMELKTRLEHLFPLPDTTKESGDPLKVLKTLFGPINDLRIVKEEKEALETLVIQLQELMKTSSISSDVKKQTEEISAKAHSWLAEKPKAPLNVLEQLEKQRQQAEENLFASFDLPEINSYDNDLLLTAKAKLSEAEKILSEHGIELPQVNTYATLLSEKIETKRAQLEQIEKEQNTKKLDALRKEAQTFTTEANKFIEEANKHFTQGEVPTAAYMKEVKSLQKDLANWSYHLAEQESKRFRSHTLTVPEISKIRAASSKISNFQERFAHTTQKQIDAFQAREKELQLELETALGHTHIEIPKILSLQLIAVERAPDLEKALKEFDTLETQIVDIRKEQNENFDACRSVFEMLDDADKTQGILSLETRDAMDALRNAHEHPSKEIEKKSKKAQEKITEAANRTVNPSLIENQVDTLRENKEKTGNIDLEKVATVLQRISDRQLRYEAVKAQLKKRGIETDNKFREVGETLDRLKDEVSSMLPTQEKRRKGSLTESKTQPREEKLRKLSLDDRELSANSLRFAREERKSAPAVLEHPSKKEEEKIIKSFERDAKNLHTSVTELNQQMLEAKKGFKERFSVKTSREPLELHQTRNSFIAWLGWLDEAVDTVLANYSALVEEYNACSNPLQKEAFYKALMPLEQPIAITTKTDEELSSLLMSLIRLDLEAMEETYKILHQKLILDSNVSFEDRTKELVETEKQIHSFKEEITDARKVYEPLRKNDPMISTTLHTLSTRQVELEIYLEDVKHDLADEIELLLDDALDPAQEPVVEGTVSQEESAPAVETKVSDEEAEPIKVETETEQHPVISETETVVSKEPAEPMAEETELEIVVTQSKTPTDTVESEVAMEQPAAAQQPAHPKQSLKPTRKKPAEFDLHHLVVTTGEKISAITTEYAKKVTKGLAGFGKKIRKVFSFKRPSSTSGLVKGFPPTETKRPVSAIEAEKETRKSTQQRKIVSETSVSMERKPSSLSLEERRERVEKFDHEAYAKGIASLGAEIQRLRVEVFEEEKQSIAAKNVLKGIVPIEYYSMKFRDKNTVNFDVPKNQYEINSPKAIKDLAKVLVACGQARIDISELPQKDQKTAQKIFKAHGIETIGVHPDVANKPKSLSEKVKDLRGALRVR